jgi:hypothetical protein
VYQISISIVQGQEWVVIFGCYKVVGANVFAHSQETILTLRITTFVVKVMISGCKKTKNIFDLDADLHTSNIAPSSMFIDLFGFLSKEGLPSLVESSTVWLHPSLSIPLKTMFCQPTSKPSTLILSI